MAKWEVKIAGFGGQGVVLAGGILGKAAAIYDNKYATLTHSYGPEARGGGCVAQVIISDEKILYPYIVEPDVLVVMSQEAYDKYASELKEGGKLIVEQELVQMPEEVREKSYGIPATRMAESLGSKIVLNLVILGFLTAVSGIITANAMRESIRSTVPKGTEYLNILAFDKGFEYGEEILKLHGH